MVVIIFQFLLADVITAASDKEIIPRDEFSVDEDEYGKIVRVNVEKIQDSTWPKVPGIKKYFPITPPPDETKLTHAVISNMKDVDGDGKIDIFRQLIEKPYSQVARFDDTGKLVWISKKLAPAAGDESGMPIVDLDGDGKYELVLSQWAKIYCIDADTGKIKWKKPLEKGGKPGPGSWDYPMVVGHFGDEKKLAVVVRAGLNVLCLTSSGETLWTYSLKGHTYGHALCRYDVDDDGYDEVFIGRNANTTALRSAGKLLWEDTSQKNHTDNFAFGDIDSDGRCEVIYDHDGCGGRGPLYVADAVTGRLKFTIDYHKKGMRHCQGFTVANFRPKLQGLEIVVVDKQSLMLLYDSQGNLLWKRNTPSSLVTKADWDGDGQMDILVFAVGINLDPAMSVWNGQGERLYAISWLPAPVRSHASMCAPGLGFDGFDDRDGNGRADVLVAYGPWKTGNPQYLFLMEAQEDF